MSSLLNKIRRRLRVLFRGGALQRDIEDEMRFHIQMEAEQLRRSGLSDTQARRAALVSFGGLDRTIEQARDAHGGRRLHEFVREHYYACRALRRTPLLTLAAALTLSLGVGGATALFTLVDGVLLEPLPFRDAARLELVGMVAPGGAVTLGPLSPLDFGDLAERSRTFEQLAAVSPGRRTLHDDRSDPVRVAHTLVTANFFRVLGRPPALGRIFGEADGVPGAEAVAVLSHDFWRRRFGGDSTVVGRSLRLDDETLTVVGVLAPGLGFPRDNEIWSNYRYGFTIGARGARWLQAVGRLAPDATGDDARAELTEVAGQLARAHPSSNSGWGISSRSLTETLVGPVRPALLLLFGATSLILLLALANVSGLMVSMGEARSREFTIRGALGAGRARILRQLLSEATVLTALAAVLAFGVAALLIGGIKALGPADIPRLDTVSLDATSLIFITAIAVPVVAALALSPARRVFAGGLELGVGRPTAGSAPRAQRLARTLVAAQVAMSTLLLIVAALFSRSLERLVRQDPGFEPGEVVGFELSLPGARYASAEAVADFYSDLIDTAVGVQGVALASVASTVPLGEEGDQRLAYDVVGRPADDADTPPMAIYRKVGPSFFELLGIDVLAGRTIERADREDAPGVVVVNRSLAAEAFPGEDPVGRRLEITAGNFGARSAILVRDVEIVGVVEDVRFSSPLEPAEPTLYLSHRQAPFVGMHLLARLDRGSGPTVERLRAAVHGLDPTLPIDEVSTLVGLHADSVSRERFIVVVLAGFAIVALLLAVVGVVSIVSSAVHRRMREIAVRQALGARPTVVFGLVITETVRLLLAGAVVGAAAAAVVSGALRGMLYGAGPADTWAFAIVVAGMLGVGMVAGLAPARHVFGTDLVAILRRA